MTSSDERRNSLGTPELHHRVTPRQHPSSVSSEALSTATPLPTGHGGTILRDGRVVISRPPRTPRTRSSATATATTTPVTVSIEAATVPERAVEKAKLVTPAPRLSAAAGARGSDLSRSHFHRQETGAPAWEPADTVAVLAKTTPPTVAATPPLAPRAAFLDVLWHDLFPTVVVPYLTVSDVTAIVSVCCASRRAAQLPCVWRTLATTCFGVARPAALERLVAQVPSPRTCFVAQCAPLEEITTAAATAPATAVVQSSCRPESSPEPMPMEARVDTADPGYPPVPVYAPRERDADDEYANDNDDNERGREAPEEGDGTQGAAAFRRATLALPELDSQMPTPCERTGSCSHADVRASATPHPAVDGCHASESPCEEPQFSDVLSTSREQVSPCADGSRHETTLARSVNAPTSLAASAAVSATAGTSADVCDRSQPMQEPRRFPWEGYVRFLHRSRVSEFLLTLRRLERIRVADAEEDEAGTNNDEGGEHGWPSCAPPTPSSTAGASVIYHKRRCIERLTYSINTLSQKSSHGAMPVEHLTYLANCLLARGRLLRELVACEHSGESTLQPSVSPVERDEEGVSERSMLLALALEDLATAEILTADDAALTLIIEDTIRQLEETFEDADGNLVNMAARPFGDWLAECDLAANQPRPFAVLAVHRRLQYHLARTDVAAAATDVTTGEDDTQSRQQQHLIVLLSEYLHMLETLGLPLPHLLCRAAAVASSPQEKLLLTAARHLGAVFDPDRANANTAALAAVDAVEMALSLLSRTERLALAAVSEAWSADWLLNPSVTLAEMVDRGLTRYGSHMALPTAVRDNVSDLDKAAEGEAAVSAVMGLERLLVISLAYYTLTVAQGALAGSDAVLQPTVHTMPAGPLGLTSAPCPAETAAFSTDSRILSAASPSARCDALIHFLALSQCHHRQAIALTRLAALYADRTESGALPQRPATPAATVLVMESEEGDRLPMPAPPTPPPITDTASTAAQPFVAVSPPCTTTGAAVALRLLHTAIHLCPVSVPAHIALSRLYARQERGEAVPPLPPLALSAYELLSHCLHAYAVPFLPPRATNSRRSGGGTEHDAACATTGRYLHRKDRHPSVCFLPVELLCERSRAPKSRSHGSLLFFTASTTPGAFVGRVGMSHRSLADLYEAVLHDPRASYPRQVKAAVALDAATNVRRGTSEPTMAVGADEVDGLAPNDSDSAFRSLFAAADRELCEVLETALRESDAALRLRFLSDSLERRCHSAPVDADTEPGAETADARRHRLHTEVLHTLGLLAVLVTGQGTELEGGAASATAEEHVASYFPAQLASRMREGAEVFLTEMQRWASR